MTDIVTVANVQEWVGNASRAIKASENNMGAAAQWVAKIYDTGGDKVIEEWLKRRDQENHKHRGHATSAATYIAAACGITKQGVHQLRNWSGVKRFTPHELSVREAQPLAKLLEHDLDERVPEVVEHVKIQAEKKAQQDGKKPRTSPAQYARAVDQVLVEHGIRTRPEPNSASDEQNFYKARIRAVEALKDFRAVIRAAQMAGWQGKADNLDLLIAEVEAIG